MPTSKRRHMTTGAVAALVSAGVVLSYMLSQNSETECILLEPSAARSAAEAFVQFDLEATDVFHLKSPCSTRITMKGSVGKVGDLYILGDGQTILNGSIHRPGDTIDIDPSVSINSQDSQRSRVQSDVATHKPATLDAIALPQGDILPDQSFVADLTIPPSDASDKFMEKLALLHSIANPHSSGHDVFIFMDPYCGFCQEMYESTPTLEKAGLRSLWIPVATGINSGSIDAAAGILDQNSMNHRWAALSAWMMQGIVDNPSEPSVAAIDMVKVNTENLASIAKHIPSAGTPLILVRGAESGSIFIFNGSLPASQILAASKS